MNVNIFIVIRLGKKVPKDIYQPSNSLFTKGVIMQEGKIYMDLLLMCVHQWIIKMRCENADLSSTDMANYLRFPPIFFLLKNW